MTGIAPNYVALVVSIIKERADFVSEFWNLSHYFFRAPKSYDTKSLKKVWKEDSANLMLDFSESLRVFEAQSVSSWKLEVKQLAEQKGVGVGKVMMPLRIAVVGSLEGADLFEILLCIGKDEAAARIKKLIDKA